MNIKKYASVTAIESDLDDLYTDNMALAVKVDALKQNSKQNSLLLHGRPESDHEDQEADKARDKDMDACKSGEWLLTRSRRLLWAE